MRRVLFSALLAAGLAAGQHKGSISGTVVNAITGAPLNKVTITAESTSVTSDSEGRFLLADLPAGQYRLRGTRNGYLENTGTPITLDGGQSMKDVRFRLTPFCVIAGTVRDEDGEPMVGVSVAVMRIGYQNGMKRVLPEATADTDDLGQYRIPDLAPGRYYARAEKDSAPARPVEVGVGERVTGIDITLTHPKTVRVSGHAVVPAGAHLSAVSLKTSEDAWAFGVDAFLQSNGDFEFAAVPPGIYTLTAISKLPKKPATDIFELAMGQGSYRTQMPLAIGTEPLKDVRISIDGGAEVSGHLSVAAPGAHVEFEAGPEYQVTAFVHDDQTFSTNLGRGHYHIVRQMPSGYIVSKVLVDGRDVLEEGLSIAGPGKLSLEIVLSKDGGRIEGVVADKDGKPVAGATVVLVPAMSRRSQADLFLDIEADQQGRYKIESIPPGNYKLFAWEEVEPGIWWDPEFLGKYEAKGEPVVIKPGSREAKNLTSGSSR